MWQEMGPLSRVNKLTLPRNETAGGSVFSLQHWSACREERETPIDASNPAANQSFQRRKSVIYHASQAGVKNIRLFTIKAQESALNFLLSWVMLDESERAAEAEWQRRASTAQSLGRKKSIAVALASGVGYTQENGRKSSSLLGNITKLPDRRFSSIMKFIFWRWLTWVNFFEFLMIVFLIICCYIQCYELLEDYFSYPTSLSVNKILNDDYLVDLPAITLCNKNLISKETLRIKHPELNESHFMAITLGTFYSVNNYSLRRPGDEYFSDLDDDYEEPNEGYVNATKPNLMQIASKQATKFNASDIDWIKVSRYLNQNKIALSRETHPSYDLIDTITCSNIWGDQMPCQDFKRLETTQQGSHCTTLFHDSVLWDSRDPAVRELESAFSLKPSSARSSDEVDDIDAVPMMDFNNEEQLESSQWAKLQEADLTKVSVDMQNMEMIRLRINFRPDDYANKRSVVGGLLAIHPNTYIATISHIAYNIEPGFWYTYYLERFDFKRLPPPYKTKCFDYQQNRYDWVERSAKIRSPENRAEIHRLIKKQAMRPSEVVREYADNLLFRSMGKVSF